MEFLKEENRIYFDKDGKTLAELLFPANDENTVTITRTFVDESLRGQGVAGKLMAAFMEIAKDKNLKVVPQCSYAEHWFGKHPEYKNFLK